MKKLFVACVLSLFAASVRAVPKCSAVYDATTTTLTLYYDEVDHTSEGSVYELPAAKPEWPTTGGFKDATKIVFDSSFHDWKPASCTQWFYQFTKASSFVGIENWDVSECTNMRRLFCRCPVEVLDLSAFETGKCTAFNEMFSGCGNLVTIYASANFDTSKSTTFDKMFDSCTKLVGGNNTKFDANNDYQTYARIDLPGQPGYFTAKNVQLPPTIKSVTVSGIEQSVATVSVDGSNLQDGEVTVELRIEDEAVASLTESDYGEFAFTGLTPSTAYDVWVVASNAYGAVTNDTHSFTTLGEVGDCWSYNVESKTISWGGWTFTNVTVAAGTHNITVGKVVVWPEQTSPLDFSLPVIDGDGAAYVISILHPQFCYMKSGAATAWDPSPCEALGRLTLPGDGLVTINDAAFAQCKNASGDLVFPSTLTKIGSSAFDGCEDISIDGTSLPEGLIEITGYCFRNVGDMSGDVVLPNVKTVGQAAFQNTDITSVTFGPDLAAINGNNERGAFQGCTLLTNVTFDATSKARLVTGYTFKGCTELEELNLGGVVDVMVNPDRNDYSHINGCSKLKKITFGAGLTNLMCNAMAGATALEKVVFEGVPPVGLQIPYLSPYDRNGKHATGYDSKTIMTYVHRNLINTPNEAGTCWADYAAGGKIEAEKTSGNTTWAAEYVYEGIDLTNRPLVTIESGTKTGIVILFK